jgi:FixJ family two-component response regulator
LPTPKDSLAAGGVGPWANSTIDVSAIDIGWMTQASSWIAIVDDDPAVLRALARLLNTRALEARTFTSARDFLSALPDGLPECLIVDLQMPDMTGLELQLHLNRLGIQIPTIVITAHNEADMRELCKSAGAANYLLKPLQDTSLLAAISSARRGGRPKHDRPA